MADDKSREVVGTGKAAEGYYVEYADGMRKLAIDCEGIYPDGPKINIDVSGALKGLKAIQREARKAASALKELDDIKRCTCPECGLISIEITKAYAGEEVIAISKECKDCGWHE